MRYGLSLDRPDWDRLAHLMNALPAWNPVPLELAWDSLVPEKSGAYIIEALPPIEKPPSPLDRLRAPLYVGQSGFSLRLRFRSHCKGELPGLAELRMCYRGCGGSVKFWFTEMVSSGAVELERQLIQCYGPPANRQSGVNLGRAVPAGR